MIRVSLLGTLNDPFELMPYLRYGDADKRKRIKLIRRSFSGKYGLLCFSGTWTEPLLWGHYADKHKGVALGFELLHDQIIEVEYTSSPVRKQIEVATDSEDNEKLFFDLAKIKYHKWEYENEYRILVALKDCTEIDGQRFLRFDERLKIKEIILGCNYDNSLGYIVGLARQLGAEVIPTRMEWQGYRIKRCGRKTKEVQQMLVSIE